MSRSPIDDAPGEIIPAVGVTLDYAALRENLRSFVKRVIDQDMTDAERELTRANEDQKKKQEHAHAIHQEEQARHDEVVRAKKEAQAEEAENVLETTKKKRND